MINTDCNPDKVTHGCLGENDDQHPVNLFVQ